MNELYIVNVYRKKEKVGKYLQAISSVFPGKILVVDEDGLTQIQGPAIITGSEKMVGDGEVSERLLDFIRKTSHPLLGICYGHQAIGKAFGHRVYKCGKHKGSEEILKIMPSPLLEGLGRVFEMEESHYECVGKEGPLLVTAVNRENNQIVEAVQHPRRPVFGVQFHPERTRQGIEIVLANFLRLSFQD